MPQAMLFRILLATLAILWISPLANAQYVIGAGDTLTISILGQPESKREALPVSPDGTVTYLGATKVRVAGLTVAKAREAIETGLQQLNARVILVPVSVGSKSYSILGLVSAQDRVPLTRRTTLLEAIARAGGITKDNLIGSVGDQANFNQSFLLRKGKRVPVDFHKLCREADMSQNVVLQDKDYIYLASNLEAEFYIFGFVNRQGLQRVTPGLGVVGAITQQGGFAHQAWKHRVLLVRGTSTKPQAVTVNFSEIIRGKQPDIPILAGDILYVHKRPWYYAESILDEAFSAIIQGATLTAVNKATVGNR